MPPRPCPGAVRPSPRRRGLLAAVALVVGVVPLLPGPAAAQVVETVPAPALPVAAPELAVGVESGPYEGRSTPVVGHLLDARLQPLAGETVELYEQPTDGARRLVGVALTDAVGAVVFRPTPVTGTRYVLRHPASGSAPELEDVSVPVQTRPAPSAPPPGVAVVAEDGALRVSWTDPDPGRVRGYDVRVGDRTTRVQAGQSELLVGGLANGTSQPVGVRALYDGATSVETTGAGTPRSDAPRPSPGAALCGTVTDRTTTLTAGTYRVCRAGLSVAGGALLTVDASAGPVVVHLDGARQLSLRGGELRTVGTAPGRGLTVDQGNAPSLGFSVGGPYADGEDPSSLRLQHAALTLVEPVFARAARVLGLRDTRLVALGARGAAVESQRTPTTLERVSATGAPGSEGVALTCLSCPLLVDTLDVERAGATGLRMQTDGPLRAVRVLVRDSGRSESGGPYPAVQVSGTIDGIGPGRSLDDLRGAGNAIEAVALSGGLTGSLTWETPTPGREPHALGQLLAGRLAVGGGAALTVPGLLQSGPGGRLDLVGSSLRTVPGAVLTGAGDPVPGGIPCPSSLARTCQGSGAVTWDGVRVSAGGSARLDGTTVRGAFAVLSGTPDTTLDIADSTVEDVRTVLAGGASSSLLRSTVRRASADTFDAQVAAVRAVARTVVDGTVFEDVRGDAVRLVTGAQLTSTTFRRVSGHAVVGQADRPRIADVSARDGGLAPVSLSGDLLFGPGGIERVTGGGNADDAVHLAGRLIGAMTWQTPYRDTEEHPLGHRLDGAFEVPTGSVLSVPEGGVVTRTGSGPAGFRQGLVVAGGVLDASAGGAVVAGAGDPRVFPVCPGRGSPCRRGDRADFGHLGLGRGADGTPGRLLLEGGSVWGAELDVRDGSSATVTGSRLVDTPVTVTAARLDLTRSRLRGAGLAATLPTRLHVQEVQVDEAPEQGVVVEGSESTQALDLVLRDLTVTRSGRPGSLAAAVALKRLRTTVGPGLAVDGLRGHSNALDALNLDEVRLDADLRAESVRNQGVLHPLGILPGHLGTRSSFVTMTPGTTLVLPRGAVLKTAGTLVLDGASLDASAGGATLTGSDDDTVGPRTCVRSPGPCDAITQRLFAQPAGGSSPTVRGLGLDARVRLVVRDSAGSSTESPSHGVVLRQSRLTGVEAERSATDLTDVAVTAGTVLSGAPAAGGRSRALNSVLTNRFDDDALDVRGTDVDLDRLTLRGGAAGDTRSRGLHVSNTSGSYRCLDLRGSRGPGVLAQTEAGDPGPYTVSLTDSVLTGNSTAQAGGPDLLTSVPFRTTGVWWGQPGGPRQGQVQDRVLLVDSAPASGPPACAGGSPALPPTAPTAVTAVLEGGGVVVRWRGTDPGATAYTVTDALGRETVVDGSASQATVALPPGGASSYDVRARNAVSDSPPATSPAVGAAAVATPEPAPVLPDRASPTGTPTPSSGATPSASSVPSPTATPGPVATTTAPRPTSDPTSTAGPTAGPTAAPTATSPAEQTPVVTLSPAVITAGQPITVEYRGTPGSVLQVSSKTQPATAYSRIATVTLGADGRATTRHTPRRNTRLQATTRDGRTSGQPLVQVRSVASVNAARTATRTYRVSGSVVPARAGRLVSLYVGGRLAGQARTDAKGVYRLVRRLPAGTSSLQVRTGDDTYNLGTRSRTLRVAAR